MSGVQGMGMRIRLSDCIPATRLAISRQIADSLGLQPERPRRPLFLEVEILNARRARLLSRARPHGAIVNGKFLKVRENGQREFGAPSVPAKLERGCGVRANFCTALLGLSVKLRQGTDAESVIRGFLLPFHIQTVFGNDFSITAAQSLTCCRRPSQGLQRGGRLAIGGCGLL